MTSEPGETCQRIISLSTFAVKLTFDDWHYRALLNGRGALETVRIDTLLLFNNFLLVFGFRHEPRSSSGFKDILSNESVTSS